MEQQLSQRQLEVDELKLSQHRAAIATLKLDTALDDEELALLPAREALAASQQRPRLQPMPSNQNQRSSYIGTPASRPILHEAAPQWLDAEASSRPKTAKSMLSSLGGNLSDVMDMDAGFNLSFSRPPTAAQGHQLTATTSQDYDFLAFDDDDALVEAPTPLPPSLRHDEPDLSYRSHDGAVHQRGEGSRPSTAHAATSLQAAVSQSRPFRRSGPTNYNELRDNDV